MSSNTIQPSAGPWRARVVCAAAIAAAALGALGCQATFTPTPLSLAYEDGTTTIVAADSLPPDIWAYPHVYYGGAWAYLVNGRWYQPTPQGWMLYLREPVELSRHRTRIYASPELRRAPAYQAPTERRWRTPVP